LLTLSQGDRHRARVQPFPATRNPDLAHRPGARCAFKVPDAARFTNQFFSICGGRVPRQPAGTDSVLIPAGSLDGEPPIALQSRIFTGSRASHLNDSF